MFYNLFLTQSIVVNVTWLVIPSADTFDDTVFNSVHVIIGLCSPPVCVGRNSMTLHPAEAALYHDVSQSNPEAKTSIEGNIHSPLFLCCIELSEMTAIFPAKLKYSANASNA